MGTWRYVNVFLAIGVTLSWAAPLSAASISGSPESLVHEVMDTGSSRLRGVDVYVEKIHGGQLPMGAAMGTGGQSYCSHCRVFKTEEVTLADGSKMKVGRALSPTEVSVLAGIAPSSSNLAAYGGGMAQAQDALGANADKMLGPWAGAARSAFGDTSLSTNQVQQDIEKKSWESDEREAPWLNPFRMMGGGAGMFLGTAQGVREAETSLGQSRQQASANAARTQAMLADAKTIGVEQVNGRPAVHIDLPIPEDLANEARAMAANKGHAGDKEQSFLPTHASMWIDTEKHVIVKHRVEGIATANGESRDFFIESSNSDYRNVPGSHLYEPYKRVMRMGGIMDAEQMAKMEEARKQLAEFDKRLASMPPGQRKMVENMMGNQMDTVRSLANGGGLEFVETIDEILVNPDLKTLFSASPASAKLGSAAPAGENLLQQIQAHLVTLGYEPGNTNGVLDTMTKVAISQFQAEYGLAVTGEPSQALANSLAAETAR